MHSSEDELHDGSWELAAPNLGPPDSSFMAPRSAYIEARAACIQGGGGAAAGDGSAFLDLAHVGLFGLMDSNADSTMFMVSKPSDLCMQQSTQYKQGGEERRQLSSATQPPQPPRRANQQSYSISTSRQLSRSVPSSPTFATSRLHMNSVILGGGGSGATAPTGRGNRLPIIAKNLPAHTSSNQQASSSASVLTASLDLASCTSNLLPPSPGSIRSANFSSDHAAAAGRSNFSSDHAAKSSNFSSDQAAAASPTSFNTDHAARSAKFGSDQASAARPVNFSSDHASRSTNFSSELAAAASLFLPFFPSTPANSTTGLNPSAAEQDQYLQAPVASCATNYLAKKRRLQGVKSKSSSKLAGADGLAATEDTLADVLPLNQGGATVEMARTEPEMSNNSANNEEEECGMKGNSSITISSKTQDCEGPQPPPPKQDYIHVRARRGQATDSHSLAERVRREKISERMKFLQDLVPGCNKITGKAVMLDEIINYVQSLQRQVEFLSMKLSAVSPQTKRFEASHLINHAEPKSIQTSTTLQFNQINEHHHLDHDLHLSMPLLLDVQQAPQHHQHPSNMGASQAWDDELQNLVQMGFPTLP